MCVRESESWEGVTVVRTFQGSPRPFLYPSEYNNFPILIALLLEAKGLVKIVAEQTEAKAKSGPHLGVKSSMGKAQERQGRRSAFETIASCYTYPREK